MTETDRILAEISALRESVAELKRLMVKKQKKGKGFERLLPREPCEHTLNVSAAHLKLLSRLRMSDRIHFPVDKDGDYRCGDTLIIRELNPDGQFSGQEYREIIVGTGEEPNRRYMILELQDPSVWEKARGG